MIDKKMTAYCGADCKLCERKDKVGCKGCKSNKGNMFWGQCDKAVCCIEKGFEHCSECKQMPCDKLTSLFNDPEHGDEGTRLQNLINLAEEKAIASNDLKTIPGVGKATKQDLIDLGYTSVSSLVGANPEELYERECTMKGKHIDRCQLYVYRCAVYYAEHDVHDPEKLKWWYWKDKQYPQS